MEVVKNILTIIYLIVCAILIIITLLQNKERNSMEDIAENPNANKYYDKTKGRTKGGKVQRNTIIIGIIFAVLTIALGIVYVL